jgi:DNA topoisomerase-1
MTVVVVESPAKAKTINKYLGSDFIVLASVGHVRDLARKDGAVDPNHDFTMNWEVNSDKQKNIKAISDALINRNKLILATDPDREGEAISWHLLEVLQKRKAIKKSTVVERVVFNAITKNSVTEAMKAPREINMPLVNAYLARRALDHLVGFNLSPVLWRKCPGGAKASAGRVQSPSLRLVVEREMEIESFRSEEYWSVKVQLQTGEKKSFDARLVKLDDKKIEKMTIKSCEQANSAAKVIRNSKLVVSSISSSPKKRNPSPPFMTSTLQQEASRKLGLGAKNTMSTAQRLYESGLITYMRTDGIDMSPEAVSSARSFIKNKFGTNYLPLKPRIYKNASKNAQEAHECIRPTEIGCLPGDLGDCDKIQRDLYKLIWNRTVSSQMESASFESTAVEIQSLNKQVGLRANGQVMLFDGFLKVYSEGKDDEKNNDDERILPAIKNNENIQSKKVSPEQHFTQPPPRYTEATLVKKMEELGIGRPSTYASIISTIQDREYVKIDKNRLIPEDKGRLITIFLTSYFNKYLQYDYTADLEKKLDKVSSGEVEWKNVLNEFWKEFNKTINDTADLSITEALEKLNDVLTPHIFPTLEEGTDPRVCRKCGNGRLSMRTSRSGGAFIGCSNYPDCRYTRALTGEAEAGDINSSTGIVLGQNESNEEISIRTGRFGPYVQLGEQKDGENTPKRTSIPKGISIEALDLEKAIKLLSLPRKIGLHPEDGIEIEAAIGRYGAYVKHDRTYANLSDPDEVFNIGMNRSIELLSEKIKKGGRYGVAKVLRELGEHPKSGIVEVLDGKYGPYVRWNKINATIPKDSSPEQITLEMAVSLINEKAERQPIKKKRAKKK